MSSVQDRSEPETDAAGQGTIDAKLEVVVIPVSDVDRAKDFYASLGWRLDADVAAGEDFRLVQITPPGSGCSIQFGTKLTSATPGSAQGLYLIVSDLKAARGELVSLGVDVSEVFHEGAGGARSHPAGASDRITGPAPEQGSYRSFATFSDPDGNGWLLQEVTTRLPGRIDPAAISFASASDLSEALQRAATPPTDHRLRRTRSPRERPDQAAAR